MSIVDAIRSALEEHHLLQAGEPVVVGVSGGADSVALLHALHQLKFPCTVAHLNHQLRGAESDADEQFVRDLAHALNLPIVVGSADVRALAETSGHSIEMAARQARHTFFAQFGEMPIALAHHADDQVETFLLRLARGAGSEGLSGMAPRQQIGPLCLIRPMLQISRSDIMAWLNQQGLTWREDASNTDENYRRNRVRHRVLPLLEETLNSEMRNTILRTMEILRAENDWMNDLVSEHERTGRNHKIHKGHKTDSENRAGAGDNHEEHKVHEADSNRDLASCPSSLRGYNSFASSRLSGQMLLKQPLALQRRILRNWLFNQGVEQADFETVETILGLMKSGEGTTIHELNSAQRVVIEYGSPRFEQAPFETRETEWKLSIKAGTGWRRDHGQGPGILPAEASVCASKASNDPITVRAVQPGDRIRPFGMEGTRKLQDILTDLKIPRAQRCSIPVVVCRDEIIWVPGYRIAQGWAVVANDAKVLHLKIEPS